MGHIYIRAEKEGTADVFEAEKDELNKILKEKGYTVTITYVEG